MNVPLIGQAQQPAIPMNVAVELMSDGSIGLHLSQGMLHAVAPMPLLVAKQVLAQLDAAINQVEDVHLAALTNGRSAH